MDCESCQIVNEQSEAVTVRNGQHVCQDCADEIDSRETETAKLRETAYDERGVRK